MKPVWMQRLGRLVQPRNPRFWLFLTVNTLNTALAWWVRSHEVSATAAGVAALFALGNAALGAALLWSLWTTPPIKKNE